MQRNGRGIRQGNQNKKVYIYTYVTEKTFDAYMFQGVETKQKFISQIMTSKTPVRTMEDVDEKALSYGEIKALATGNKDILRKTELDAEVAKLKILKQNHLSQIYDLESKITKMYPQRIKELEEIIQAYDFDKKHLDLYVFDEYSTVKTRNETVFKILYDEEKKVSREECVIADSAEPKSIADFKAYGAFIRPADKGPDSVRYGIKWLQGLNHIYIDKKKCPETYREFVNYEYEQDKDGNFISSYPDEDNHSIDAVRYAMEKYANRKGN